MIVIFLLLAWVSEIGAYAWWNSCWLFKGNFYYSLYQNSLEVEASIHDEHNIPFGIIRVFNNKPASLFHGILQALLQYFDIRFLITFISLIGGIGLYYALWHIFTHKKTLWFIPFVGGVIFLCISQIVFAPSYPLVGRFSVFAICFEILSIFGLYTAYKKAGKKGHVLLWVFLLISLLFTLVFPMAYQEYCLLK